MRTEKSLLSLGKGEATQQVPEQTLQFSCQATPSSSQIPVQVAIEPLVQRDWKTKTSCGSATLICSAKSRRSRISAPSEVHLNTNRNRIVKFEMPNPQFPHRTKKEVKGSMLPNPLWKGEMFPHQPPVGPSSSPVDQVILMS